MLAVATPESVARLNKTPLRQDAEYFSEVYYNEQSHSSFCSFLKTVLMQAGDAELSVQVSYFDKQKDVTSFELQISLTVIII